MNKPLLIIFCIIASAFTAVAKVQPLPPGMTARDCLILITTGGYVYVPNSGYGKLLFLNSQTRVPPRELEQAKKIINDEIFIAVELANKPQKAEITIELVDCENDKSLSIYPDEKRAVVNINPLCRDNPSAVVLSDRTVKQMLRAFVFLAGGGGGGNRKGTLMDVMTTMDRLDKAPPTIPGDLVLRCEEYLLRSGIKMWTRVTYKNACEAGWAEQPTNKWQQAIWDKVHSAPKNPIRIEFDPKKGR
jgi:hypothetical protein